MRSIPGSEARLQRWWEGSLRELSKDHQVICVTHLPQIACYADTHYSVRKEVKGGRTITRVERLGKGDGGR